VANDGIKNGTEAGLAAAIVKLTNTAGTTTFDTVTTDATGAFTLYVAGVSGALKITETNAPTYVSTGASVGTTAGTYTRNTDTIDFTLVAGTNYTGVDFGDVPPNAFAPNGALAGLPGSFVQVTFSTTNTAIPPNNAWTATLYLDVNGNGQLDPTDTVITAPIALTAGQTIKILVKESIPANAPLNAQDKLTLTASFSYTNAVPALLTPATVTDITTVGNPTTAGLTLVKAVDKTTALPGDTINYTVTYTNNSSDILSNVIIYDTTPAYTVFVSAGNGPLPANLTGVTITNPAVGNTGPIRWTFTGTLAPGGRHGHLPRDGR
jgi:uncharacterized repeat protein (TIGR01451 family)